MGRRHDEREEEGDHECARIGASREIDISPCKIRFDSPQDTPEVPV